MILLIDNYDSFSYNLYQLAAVTRPDIRVVRNDELTVEEVKELNPDKILLSPGPGKPADAGICIDLVRVLSGKIPILGVCLGHQAICEAFGATVGYAKTLMHGKQSVVKTIGDSQIFRNLPQELTVGRYHSLAAIEETLPSNLLVTARSEDNEIMAIRHATHPTFGLQFHPESILTPLGATMLENFLKGGNDND